MNIQKELKELGGSKFKQWRAIIDELEVQLALGKADAKDFIEQEKKNLSEYIRKQKNQLTEEDRIRNKYQQELKELLEDLYRVTHADLAKSKRSYDRNKKEILRQIHLLELQFKQKAREYDLWLRDDLDELKDVLDTYRIQLALSSYESLQEINEVKKELHTELEKVIDKITHLLYPEENKVNIFIDEISESLEHLKRAFSEVFSENK